VVKLLASCFPLTKASLIVADLLFPDHSLPYMPYPIHVTWLPLANKLPISLATHGEYAPAV
jgi:hypothetical protein